MNDIFTRFGIALVAGLTFLGSHIPDNMALVEMINLPAKIWVLFVVNALTGYISPSVVRATIQKSQGIVKK